MSEHPGEYQPVDKSTIVDLFAGPGGWSEGLRLVGLHDIGIEWDDSACHTRVAAGHCTVRADVEHYPPEPFRGYTGLIASPPCQDFSIAGLRAGRVGAKGRLIDLVPVWVDVVRPEWVACEQTPLALPIWQEHAHYYRELGYSTWTGILNAADYGVPQTRRRAVLMASRVAPASPPVPTHGEDPVDGLFGTLLPWVSMEDALGLVDVEMAYKRGSGLIDRHGERPSRHSSEPAFTLTGAALGGGGGAKMVLRTGTNTMKHSRKVEDMVEYVRPIDRPAPTLDTKVLGAWKFGEGKERPITECEALTLQSFRPDYPMQGNKGKRGEQIGNAVPPLLAAHVIGALTGCGQPAEVAA